MDGERFRSAMWYHQFGGYEEDEDEEVEPFI